METEIEVKRKPRKPKEEGNSSVRRIALSENALKKIEAFSGEDRIHWNQIVSEIIVDAPDEQIERVIEKVNLLEAIRAARTDERMWGDVLAIVREPTMSEVKIVEREE